MMFLNGLLFVFKCGLVIIAMLIELVVIVAMVLALIDKIKEFVGEADK